MKWCCHRLFMRSILTMNLFQFWIALIRSISPFHDYIDDDSIHQLQSQCQCFPYYTYLRVTFIPAPNANASYESSSKTETEALKHPTLKAESDSSSSRTAAQSERQADWFLKMKAENKTAGSSSVGMCVRSLLLPVLRTLEKEVGGVEAEAQDRQDRYLFQF